MRPEGRGWVRLASADPAAKPRILSNVLSTENDRAFFRRVIPQMREILATKPLADVVKGEMLPGPAAQSTEEIDAWVRQFVGTAMHPVGTCAMGTGAEAVCDEKLRVRGVAQQGDTAAAPLRKRVLVDHRVFEDGLGRGH